MLIHFPEDSPAHKVTNFHVQGSQTGRYHSDNALGGMCIGVDWSAAEVATWQAEQLRDAKKFHMPFGKHAGLMLEQLPADYLRWMVATIPEERNPELIRKVRLVLQERGQDYAMNEMDITLHAIDRFSLRALHLWQARGGGIVGCVRTLAEEARAKGTPMSSNKEAEVRFKYKGCIWPFRVINGVYTLTTVIKLGDTSHADRAHQANPTTQANS